MLGKHMTGKLAQATDGVHTAIQDLLASYATTVALGMNADEAYPEVADHLQHCSVCRADLAELVETTDVAYSGTIVPAQTYPQVNLAFLRSKAAEQSKSEPWLIDAFGRLIVQFSDQLLVQLRLPGLAGAARGQRLYRYVQESGSLQDLNVTIDVFAEDVTRGPGHVRVVVEVLTLSPLEQGGSKVTVRAGGDMWEGETDDTGSVDFAPVPLEIIPQLRVEIDPRRE